VAPDPLAIAPGEFATSEGVWEYESPEGKTEWRAVVTHDGVEWVLRISALENPIYVFQVNAADHWFIYMESPRVLWVHDGKDGVIRTVFKADGSMDHEMAKGQREFDFKPETKAPQVVLDRLPEEMRKLIPAAPAPPPPPPKKVRPSI